MQPPPATQFVNLLTFSFKNPHDPSNKCLPANTKAWKLAHECFLVGNTMEGGGCFAVNISMYTSGRYK